VEDAEARIIAQESSDKVSDKVDISDSEENSPANHWGSSRKEMLDGDADDDNAQREAYLEVLLDMLELLFFASTRDKPFSSGLVHSLNPYKLPLQL
jgi:hypothetical protein